VYSSRILPRGLATASKGVPYMTKILTDTKQLDGRGEAEKELDRIRGIAKTSERWKAIRGFMWRLNPETYTEDRTHCEEVSRERREDYLYNPSAISKSGDNKRLVSVPTYLYMALQVADPSFRHGQSKDGNMKKTWYKIWDVFPEYRIAIRKGKQ